MKRNPTHGGKRPGAGRKPGSSASLSCPTCAVLMKQLEESGKREARLLKQLETQQGQIGQVIQSKFETVHISGDRPQSDISNPVPLEALVDVDKHDDESFLKSVGEMITQ